MAQFTDLFQKILSQYNCEFDLGPDDFTQIRTAYGNAQMLPDNEIKSSLLEYCEEEDIPTGLIEAINVFLKANVLPVAPVAPIAAPQKKKISLSSSAGKPFVFPSSAVSPSVDTPVAPIAVSPPVAPIAVSPPVAPIAVSPPVAPIAVSPPVAPIATTELEAPMTPSKLKKNNVFVRIVSMVKKHSETPITIPGFHEFATRMLTPMDAYELKETSKHITEKHAVLTRFSGTPIAFSGLINGIFAYLQEAFNTPKIPAVTLSAFVQGLIAPLERDEIAAQFQELDVPVVEKIIRKKRTKPSEDPVEQAVEQEHRPRKYKRTKATAASAIPDLFKVGVLNEETSYTLKELYLLLHQHFQTSLSASASAAPVVVAAPVELEGGEGVEEEAAVEPVEPLMLVEA
jgi:hypothetical protein